MEVRDPSGPQGDPLSPHAHAHNPSSLSHTHTPSPHTHTQEHDLDDAPLSPRIPVPPTLSQEDDSDYADNPRRVQFFMAQLMSSLFCCGSHTQPCPDNLAATHERTHKPGEQAEQDPLQSRVTGPVSVPIDRSMPTIVSGEVLTMPASRFRPGDM